MALPVFRESPVAQRFLVLTVEVPGPAMERAFEFFGVAFGAGRAQLGATMQTGVVVRADVVGGNARDDERVRAKVVDVVVTDFRDVLFAACELPGFLPQRLELALGIRQIGRASGRERV